MAPTTKRMGDAGLNEFALNNNRSQENLTELQGREGSINLKRMSKGDPVIGMILRVHKNPIRSCSWDIPYPSDATDQEKQAIDVIYKTLFGDSGAEFGRLLSQALTMLEYGFSVFEIYWKSESVDGRVYLLPVIEQRTQCSIEDVLPQEKRIRQLLADGGYVYIPFENLMFCILDQNGDDMRGTSILRNAYRAWKDKRVYKEWLGIGIQRSTSGIPCVSVPKHMKSTSDEYVAVEKMLQDVAQGNENGYIILQDGMVLTFTESKFNADNVQKAIDGCNTEMAMSTLSQFMLLGQNGNSGAFALSRDHSDYFLDGLNYVINIICGAINSKVIAPFIKYNFGETIDPSRVCLVGKNINKKAGQELGTTLANLKNAGFIRPTTNDEIDLRSSLDLPELTAEEIKKREQEPEQLKPETTGSQLFKFSEKTKNTRKEFIDNAHKEVEDGMKANLMIIKDKMIYDIKSVLERGSIEIQGLKNIEVSTGKYQKWLERKLAGIAQESWYRAKKQSASAVKFADIDVSKIKDKELKQYVLNLTAMIPDKQAAGMLNRAVLTASNNILKGLSVGQTISNVSRATDDYISSSGIIADGSLVVVGTSNFGEHQFYKEIEDQIWGYRFVAIDDDVTSDICRWYNGKTFSVNSPELIEATPPLHPNCRSYLEPVYKSEEQPEIDDVIAPPSVREGKTIF